MTFAENVVITEAYLMSLDEDKNYEVINGELVENSIAAGFIHAMIIDNLYDILKPYVIVHKLGHVHMDSVTYILHEDSGISCARIPDFAFLRSGRVSKKYDKSKPFPGAPDLAVEVVSPSDSASDIMAKVDDYLRYRTQQVWVVFPQLKQLHQYEQESNIVHIYNETDKLEVESLFPGLTISIADIFVDDGD